MELTSPPLVLLCSPPVTSPGGEVEAGKKVPKLKISVTGETAKCRRTSTSSLSDDRDTSEEDWSSDEGKDKGESSQGKLLLQIKKEKLVGAPHTTSVPPAKQTDPLHKLLQAKKPPSLKKKLMAIYRSVVGKTDEQGRVLSDLFMRRPSSKLYPEYYLVIKDPIDLREILGRVRMDEFAGLKELEQALELMVSNALTFNEEDSQVYRVSTKYSVTSLIIRAVCGME